MLLAYITDMSHPGSASSPVGSLSSPKSDKRKRTLMIIVIVVVLVVVAGMASTLFLTSNHDHSAPQIYRVAVINKTTVYGLTGQQLEVSYNNGSQSSNFGHYKYDFAHFDTTSGSIAMEVISYEFESNSSGLNFYNEVYQGLQPNSGQANTSFRVTNSTYDNFTFFYYFENQSGSHFFFAMGNSGSFCFMIKDYSLQLSSYVDITDYEIQAMI